MRPDEPAHIQQAHDETDRNVVRRLFGEYQRGVTDMLAGTDVCP